MTLPGENQSEATLAFSFGGDRRTCALGSSFESTVGDTYRDAPATEMHQLISEVESGCPWMQAVANHFAESNPWLHRIVADPSRDLFFRINPPLKGARVLDIGAGWGQVALPLARSGFVCTVEPTAELMGFIKAASAQEGLADRMWFLQADFLELEFESRFDLVTCIGVLEWVGKFAPDMHPLEAQRRFLAKAREVLAPGGKLVIGIENRIGLKYLMGAPDDHIGHPGIAVLDFELADRKWRSFSGQPLRSATHTRAELDAMLAAAGFGVRRFHGAFPDYKLPKAILPLGHETEAYLAAKPADEHDGVRGLPLTFQDELRSHYRTLAHLGIASDFVPSFFIECLTG